MCGRFEHGSSHHRSTHRNLRVIYATASMDTSTPVYEAAAAPVRRKGKRGTAVQLCRLAWESDSAPSGRGAECHQLLIAGAARWKRASVFWSSRKAAMSARVMLARMESRPR